MGSLAGIDTIECASEQLARGRFADADAISWENVKSGRIVAQICECMCPFTSRYFTFIKTKKPFSRITSEEGLLKFEYLKNWVYSSVIVL